MSVIKATMPPEYVEFVVSTERFGWTDRKGWHLFHSERSPCWELASRTGELHALIGFNNWEPAR